jgi:uncharacterized protein (TIGR03083 family)
VVDHLGQLRSDRVLLAGLAGADLDAPVAACPAWSLGDLVSHLAMVHRFALRMLDSPPEGTASRPTERPPEGEDVWGFLDDGLARLIDDLAERGPDEPCGSFVGPVTVGWWLRRQAMETVVHRWDAEVAAGRAPSVIDGGVAADGIDEWLDLNIARGWAAPEGPGGTLHLHATDGDGEWFIEFGDTLAWRHGHQKGDVAVRGSREQLYLGCWGRVPATSLELIGDGGLFASFLANLHHSAR